MSDVRGADLVEALRRAGVNGVDDSQLARSLYASDASLYRVAPRVVAVPRHRDELAAVLQVCRELKTPLTMRGAGTSIAGNAVGTGVVVDTSRHLTTVLELDPERGTALVEPGVVESVLQQAAAPHGWRFGPDPSTHNRCTIGGMIGNNSCGSRALGYGTTSDNVLGLDLITGTGEELRLGSLSSGASHPHPPILSELQGIAADGLGVIRTEFGRFRRQVSGYALQHLLPENGFDVTRALVGTEGTLGVVRTAQLQLVRDPKHRVLVMLGYPSTGDAADDVPALLPHDPVALEGLDGRIVDVVRDRRGPSAVPDLPRGSGWLMVELAGDDEGDLRSRADQVVHDADALDSMVVSDKQQMAALWRIREDGAGLSARTLGGEPAWSGWEDAAVPPDQLGRYWREFAQLLDDSGYTGIPYGHFGDGCVHIRIDFPLSSRGGTQDYRDFVFAAARLVADHGGSFSGEHGDGRARGELLPIMYSSSAIELFSRVKRLFDPDDVLNPGIIVQPRPVQADIRLADVRPVRHGLGFSYRHDKGDVSMAVHRCIGVGKCRADTTASGGVMCPSYLATRDEKDTTRGRARVLQDVVSGALGPQGWRSQAVHDALDLCLACKGCSSDCPTGVDMASYKAEALYQKYRRRPRPRSHYSLGWLPRWSRLASRAPRAVNAVLSSRWLHPLITWAGGVDRRRGLPRFAPTTFRAWFAAQQPSAATASRRSGDVVLFVDTFTDGFSPEVGQAAVRVLEHAGYRVHLTAQPVCCGLTWISTGQLDGARRRVRSTVQALLPHVQAGATVVGLEPSCTGVLRSDALELLDGDELQAAEQVASATKTLAELLSATDGWEPPDLSGTSVVAQPHCHHHAVMGWSTDAALLDKAGADVQRLGGCCGLAGNFGVERGHYDVSVKVAEHQLLPAVRDAAQDAVVLADGFSCRTQLDDLASRSGVHLAQLLAAHLPS
ncbi:MAG TPA: FAD-linked oxidase C-terminal domain-containing protein [Actinomycetales bacterium]|nr:FAD-linked oxidase C-terminal domain-containing protein [Actinomycetales bacterium]